MTIPDAVIDSGVGEPYLDQLVRYHCPRNCILYFDRPVVLTYKRKFRKFSNGDYLVLQRLVICF